MYITILVKQVYWYISQVSGEHLQDHWSSGFLFVMKLRSHTRPQVDKIFFLLISVEHDIFFLHRCNDRINN